MRENEIDKVFKEKLAQKEFPYDPANWEKASALLDSSALSIKSYWYRIFTDLIIILALITSFTFYDFDITNTNINRSPIESSNDADLTIIEENNLDKDETEIVVEKNATRPIVETTNNEVIQKNTEKIDKEQLANPVFNGEEQMSLNKNYSEKSDIINSNNSKNLADDILSDNTEKSREVINENRTSKILISDNNQTPLQNQNVTDTLMVANEIDEPNTDITEKPESRMGIVDQENKSEAAASAIENKAPVQNKSLDISIGFESSIYGLSRELSTSNNDLNSYIDKRSSEESAKLYYSYGVMGSYSRNNWSFQTGLFYSAYEETINYNSEVEITSIIDTSYWNITLESQTDVDSSWVIDSIYTGHWKYDTTTTYYNDSNLVVTKDTVTKQIDDPNISKNNGINSVQYFEVPLYIAYTWKFNKIDLIIQPGISLGFLTRTRGSTYINYSQNGILSQEMHVDQFNQLLWTANLRTGIRYKFNPNWSIGIMPGIRYSLNSSLKNKEISQKYFSYGLNMGVYYTF